METMNLDLDRDKNKIYFDIIEKEHSKLMDRWNHLQGRLTKLKIPSFLFFRVKKELNKMGGELQTLSENYISWNNKAGEFLGKPNFTFRKEQDPALITLHYLSVLQHIIVSMESDMQTIIESYNRRWDQYKGQRNFIIAIISFSLTFLGLIAAIVSILMI